MALLQNRNSGDQESEIDKFQRLVEFEKVYRDPDEEKSTAKSVIDCAKKHFTGCDIKKFIFKTFPIIRTFEEYNIKDDLPNDMIAGLTAGVMMIPQGMAFGALSTLPPIVGLYISFFASITYFLFGTGKQLSWGCIAILSLMIATILDKYDASIIGNLQHNCNQTVINSLPSYSEESNFNGSLFLSVNNSSQLKVNELSSEEMAKRMEVASSVSVVAGWILILASKIGLHRITNIMSNSLITGFTVGVSFHVATSQLKALLGLSIPRFKGIASVLRTWVEIIKNIPDTNLVTLLISVICMAIIYLVKKFVNERYKKKMKIPIPIELFVVVLATLLSYYLKFEETYDIKIVEDVPIGLPSPKFPNLSLATDYIGDAIIIIVVSYAQTLAMAKTMGLKNNYVVDSNQEMFACGVCSVVCGMFSGYITGASVSRTVVQDGAGGKSQIASFFAAMLVLLVIMVIGPYFYTLPFCVLSSIIVVNLRTMFLKLLVIPSEWKKSRYDCAVWVFSCVATVVLNADMGLLAGVMFSLFLVILRSMLTPVVEVGQVKFGSSSNELRSLSHYSSAQQLKNVRMIKINTSLYFINADIFVSNVFIKTGVDPMILKKKSIKESKRSDKNAENAEGSMLDASSKMIKFIILDASEMSFIDTMGVQALQFIISEFGSVNKEVLITSVPESILPMLKSTGFWDKNGDRLFMSMETALAYVVTCPSEEVNGLQSEC